MDLKRDKRQNIQEKLNFLSEQTGEAAKALSVALPTAYFQSLGLPTLEDAR